MNSNGDWILKVKEEVWRELARLPKKDQERLTQVIEYLPQNPYKGDIRKMEGEENTWRRRVGAYRIKYEIKTDEKTIYVYRVERRTSKTY